MAQKATIGQKIALMAFSVLLAFAIFEFGVRFTDAGQTLLVYPSPIPGVAYQLVPNKTAGSIHGKLVINDWGFRDTDFPKEKPAGESRIFVLGDSVVYGEAAKDEAFTFVLERLLQDSVNPAGSRTINVINTGVPSYSTCQELSLLVNYLDGFSPDRVIVGYVVNDPEKPRVPFGLDLATGQINPIYRAYHWFKQNVISIKYVIAKVSPVVVRMRGGVTHYGPAVDQRNEINYAMALHDPKGPYWRRCAQCIEGFAAYQKARNVPVLFVIFPLMTEMRSPEMRAIYAQVEKTVKAAGLQVLNLHPLLMKAGDIDRYKGDGIHPSVEGHALVARFIHEFLAKQRR